MTKCKAKFYSLKRGQEIRAFAMLIRSKSYNCVYNACKVLGIKIWAWKLSFSKAVTSVPVIKSYHKFPNIGTDRSEQTVKILIRLLPMEQSDLDQYCLTLQLHLLDALLHQLIQPVQFLEQWLVTISSVQIFITFSVTYLFDFHSDEIFQSPD